MELFPWYLLYCKRSEQERAELHLTHQGVECYYPKVIVEKIRRGKKEAKIEPLFPNYLFIHFEPEKISFTTVRSTRGVANFVRIGLEPCKVSAELIQTLKNNEATQVQLNAGFSEGDSVEILEGPYAGVEAFYKESDGDTRAILLINLLHNQVELTADNKHIAKKYRA